MTVIWDGYPENRERSGWHWLQHNEDDPEPREWSTLFGEWWLGGDEDYGGGWESADCVGRNYTYLGPCLLPAEVAERVKDAEAERDRLRGLVEDWKTEPVGGISKFGVIYLSPERVAALVDPLKAECDRLRAGFLMAMQYDNKCDQTGQPCDAPKLCACFLEAETWCNVSKGNRT